MAEIDSSGGGKHKGGKAKPKKHSTRVDFTPMVDLGFLLITFFMLTTTLGKPSVMDVPFPVPLDKNDPPPPKIDDSRVFTVILGKNNKIFYYAGMPEEGQSLNFENTNYSKEGIRKILLKENRDRNPRLDSIPIYQEQLKKKIIVDSVYINLVKNIKRYNKGLIVFIKPTDECIYKNVIDIFDEMSICNIPSYSIVNLDDVEKTALNNIQVPTN